MHDLGSMFFSDDDDLRYLLAVHRALNLTPNRYQRLRKKFNSWKDCFQAKKVHLLESGLDVKAVQIFLENRISVIPEHELEMVRRARAKVLVRDSDDFPASLGQIYNPPSLLFVRGELRETDFPSISVVGSRKISSYGRRACERIVSTLAQANITIVSGLAYGVDMLAHQTAVEHGARTIAVLGNGIDDVYPQAHRSMAESWLREDKMVIISEFFPGAESRPENFPIRNRIITGLSQATIVVEATKKSGSLISAELAHEQNREVFAVPGEIFAPSSEGCNRLIAEQKAQPSLSGSYILDRLGLQSVDQQKQAKILIPRIGVEAEVLQLLEGNEKYHIDDLSRGCTIPHHQLTSTLVVLEMKGCIVHLGSQVYVKNI